MEYLGEGVSHRLSFGSLAITIAISLVLHAVAALILLSGGSGAGTGGSVTYLDLKMSSPVQTGTPTKPVEEPSPHTDNVHPVEEIHQPVIPPTASEKLQSDIKEALTSKNINSAQEAVGRVSLGLGMTKGYFRSLAQGESLRGDIRGYYLNLLQDINAKWWVDQSIANKSISAILINVAIARNGEIVAQEIVRSSGDIIYDRAVLAALVAAGPLPPLPPSYEDNVFIAPLRLMPPLNLMAF